MKNSKLILLVTIFCNLNSSDKPEKENSKKEHSTSQNIANFFNEEETRRIEARMSPQPQVTSNGNNTTNQTVFHALQTETLPSNQEPTQQQLSAQATSDNLTMVPSLVANTHNTIPRPRRPIQEAMLYSLVSQAKNLCQVPRPPLCDNSSKRPCNLLHQSPKPEDVLCKEFDLLEKFQECLSVKPLIVIIPFPKASNDPYPSFLGICEKVPYFSSHLIMVSDKRFVEYCKKPYHFGISHEQFVKNGFNSSCMKEKSIDPKDDFAKFLFKTLLLFEIHQSSWQTWIKHHLDKLDTAYVNFSKKRKQNELLSLCADKEKELAEAKKELEKADSEFEHTILYTVQHFKQFTDMIFEKYRCQKKMNNP